MEGGVKGPDLPSVEGDASVSLPSASVDVPSGSVNLPSASVDAPSSSVDVLTGKVPDVPSVEGGVSGGLPSVDAELAAPGVAVEGDDSSLLSELAAGVASVVGAAAVGLGLSADDDKPEGEVRVLSTGGTSLCVFALCRPGTRDGVRPRLC